MGTWYGSLPVPAQPWHLAVLPLGQGRFVICPWQNVNILINSSLKLRVSGFTCRRSCVRFVHVKSLTLRFLSSGTWVTFGGQISDEVRSRASLLTLSQVSIMLDPAYTTTSCIHRTFCVTWSKRVDWWLFWAVRSLLVLPRPGSQVVFLSVTSY